VLLADPRLVEWMVKIATRTKIPFQREVVARGGSGDAAPIQISLGGVTTGALSIPVRYLGSPSELLDMQDVQSAVKLLGALLRSPVKL
jgi:endoglucanase